MPSQSPFLKRLQEKIRMRGYSIKTEKAYLYWIKAFINFHHKRHPDTMGTEEVASFLSFLASVHPETSILSFPRTWWSDISETSGFTAIFVCAKRHWTEMSDHTRQADNNRGAVIVVTNSNPIYNDKSCTLKIRLENKHIIRTR